MKTVEGQLKVGCRYAKGAGIEKDKKNGCSLYNKAHVKGVMLAEIHEYFTDNFIRK